LIAHGTRDKRFLVNRKNGYLADYRNTDRQRSNLSGLGAAAVDAAALFFNLRVARGCNVKMERQEKDRQEKDRAYPALRMSNPGGEFVGLHGRCDNPANYPCQ